MSAQPPVLACLGGAPRWGERKRNDEHQNPGSARHFAHSPRSATCPFFSRELTVEYNSSEVTVEEIQQTLASVGYESSILENP